MSVSTIKQATEQKMLRSVESLKSSLGKVRTGRAHAGILDHITVEYYGSPVPINQVANVTLIDARTIGVSVWEKKLAGAVEKAIRDSDLGLNPAAMGELIRVPMPPTRTPSSMLTTIRCSREKSITLRATGTTQRGSMTVAPIPCALSRSASLPLRSVR